MRSNTILVRYTNKHKDQAYNWGILKSKLSILEEEEEKEEIEQPRVQFLDLWGFEVKDEEPVFIAKEVDLNIPEEVRKTREYLALILAHEKSRYKVNFKQFI